MRIDCEDLARRHRSSTSRRGRFDGTICRFRRSPNSRRIVDAIDSYLTRLDDAVASLERVQAKLKAYRASVLKAAVEGRLVPTEASLARAEKRDYEPAEVLLARILKERRRRWEEAELAKLKAAGKTPKDDKWKAKYEEPVAPDTSTLPELPEGWCWASVGPAGDVLTERHRLRKYLTARDGVSRACGSATSTTAASISRRREMHCRLTDFETYRRRSRRRSRQRRQQSPHLVGRSPSSECSA